MNNAKTIKAIRMMDTDTLRRRLAQVDQLETDTAFRKGAKEHLKKKVGGRVTNQRIDSAAESLARLMRSELATRAATQ